MIGVVPGKVVGTTGRRARRPGAGVDLETGKRRQVKGVPPYLREVVVGRLA
ncbi:hypothetical protein [Nonomuraea sp. NPDC001831]|uniref:hypothetical protein n=1 Tax=Nonomuraea sp. NPDC001831 TaxID=3364340 RepID=UPI00367B0327